MRFSTFFSKQARKPSGWFGRMVMSRIFDLGNARLNRFVYEILSPHPGDHILEIGCGTGKLIELVASQIDDIVVEGIDFSETMVALSLRNNQNHIRKGKVVIHKGNVDDMPFGAETFTKISSVNTIYFWPDPERATQRIARLLRPGGMLVLGFEDIAQLKRRRLDKGVFRLYSTSEVEALLVDNGFESDVSTQSIGIGASAFHGTIAIK